MPSRTATTTATTTATLSGSSCNGHRKSVSFGTHWKSNRSNGTKTSAASSSSSSSRRTNRIDNRMHRNPSHSIANISSKTHKDVRDVLPIPHSSEAIFDLTERSHHHHHQQHQSRGYSHRHHSHPPTVAPPPFSSSISSVLPLWGRNLGIVFLLLCFNLYLIQQHEQALLQNNSEPRFMSKSAFFRHSSERNRKESSNYRDGRSREDAEQDPGQVAIGQREGGEQDDEVEENHDDHNQDKEGSEVVGDEEEILDARNRMEEGEDEHKVQLRPKRLVPRRQRKGITIEEQRRRERANDFHRTHRQGGEKEGLENRIEKGQLRQQQNSQRAGDTRGSGEERGVKKRQPQKESDAERRRREADMLDRQIDGGREDNTDWSETLRENSAVGNQNMIDPDWRPKP